MESIVAWCSLITAIASLSLAAVFALRCSRLAFTVTALLKQPEFAPQRAIADLQTDVSALFSTMEKLCTTVNRLSSRQGMRDLRSRTAEPEVPPPGAPKAQLYKHYGFGMNGPDFAQRQLALERKTPDA